MARGYGTGGAKIVVGSMLAGNRRRCDGTLLAMAGATDNSTGPLLRSRPYCGAHDAALRFNSQLKWYRSEQWRTARAI